MIKNSNSNFCNHSTYDTHARQLGLLGTFLFLSLHHYVTQMLTPFLNTYQSTKECKLPRPPPKIMQQLTLQTIACAA